MIFVTFVSFSSSSACSVQVVESKELAVKMASRRPYVKVSGLLLASLFACVSAMTPSNGVEFLFPTQGATLHYNDYVQVQYTSEFSAPWLYTFCRAASGSVSRKSNLSLASLEPLRGGNCKG